MRYLYVLAALTTILHPLVSQADFKAHEWGTFTSLVGSNGKTQNGMYHEDEKLPDFVHGFGVTQDSLNAPPPVTPVPPRRPCHFKICMGDDFFENNVITQKMETPVIYFYSDQRRSVEVNVRFPEGLITETYPAPILTSPSSGDVREAKNGNTTFRVDVLNSQFGKLPAVDEGNIYGHARNVASNLVFVPGSPGRSGEMEKFIFYRGLGRFQPKFEINSNGGGLMLNVSDTSYRPRAVFLVHVNEAGDGQLLRVSIRKDRGVVDAEEIARLDDHKNGIRNGEGRISGGKNAKEKLIASLTANGLFADEAVAMVNTWEHGYLKVPGLRLLYILPRNEVEEVLPLTMTPAPDSLERVFVGRIEVLLDTEETEILGSVLKLQDQFQVASLGRFAEPKLRRVLEVYNQSLLLPDPQVQAMFGRLIVLAAHMNEGPAQ